MAKVHGWRNSAEAGMFDVVVECYTCMDGTVTSDVCELCGHRHCQTCETCEWAQEQADARKRQQDARQAAALRAQGGEA